MIRISYAVCDDDAFICEAVSDRVCSILEKCGMEVYRENYTSPAVLRSRILSGDKKYDILFLDIDMPDVSGLNLAQTAREKLGDKTDIIFVSNREDKVFDTFGVHPFGFVRKNNFSRDLADTLRSYLDLRVKSESYLTVQTNNRSVMRQVCIGDIVYIESYRYHQVIRLNDGEEIEVRMTMEELEKQLREYNIVRVHKGYLINFKYVRRIERAGIHLQYKDGVVVNVSRDKLQELKGAYLEYLRNTGAVAFEEQK